MVNPLADLIRAHCDRTGDTFQDIASRGSLSRQTLSALVNRETVTQMPRATTLEKLATGMGVPYELVRQVAATMAYGEDASGSRVRRSVAVLVAYAERMPDSRVEVLLATARALEMADHPLPDDDGHETTRDKPRQKSSRKGLAVIR